MSEIRLVNLRKEFKDIVAVRDVTITFPTATVIRASIAASSSSDVSMIIFSPILATVTSTGKFWRGRRVVLFLNLSSPFFETV